MATVKLDPAKGVQIPNLTTTERNAISSPETGALIWNTTTSAINQYNGSAWSAVDTSTDNTKLPLAGGTMTGDLDISDTGVGALTVGGTTNAYSAPVLFTVSDLGLDITDGTKHLASWATHGGSSHAGSAIGTRSNHDLALITNDTKRVIVTNAGNVGIGTTTPTGFEIRDKAIRISKQSSVTAFRILGNDKGNDLAIQSSDTADGTAYTSRLNIMNDGRGLSQFTAHAWVSWNGTGTVSIYNSYNVSSITDVGVGQFTINYSNNMGDSDPIFAGSTQEHTSASHSAAPDRKIGPARVGRSASNFKVVVVNPGDNGLRDCIYNDAIIYGAY